MVAGFQRDASDHAGAVSTPRTWLYQRPFLVRPNHDRRSILEIVEALTRYAKQPDLAHLPAWAQFRRNIGNSGDVGIWHETYLIAPGQYENIYHNMPTFGLGQTSQLVEASGRLESAEGRVSPEVGNSRREQESSPGKID